jgi:succinate dehydrogenase / fumarate reductase cytochrome b subunit
MQSSVGAKLVMAVTGLLMVGFVFVHLAGNLQMFSGAEAMNAYGVTLRKFGPLLWVARIGLLAFLLLHIAKAMDLTRRNRAARPSEYGARTWLSTKFGSRVMVLSGIFLLLYIVFHLLHFTWHVVMPDAASHTDSAGRHDIYRMVVEGFSNPAVSVLYVVAMICLGLHLSHGVSSMFQTLGWNHPRYNNFFRLLGPVVSTLVVLGYISIPLAVMFGFIS